MEVSLEGPRAKWLGFALYFAAVALLLPTTVSWDGLGFLAWSQDPLQLDFGHLLYIPLLRLVRTLLAPLTDDAVLAAQLLSVFGAALTFVLAWKRFERSASAVQALIGALFVATTPLVWNLAGTVEPSTLILAALLCAAAAAERYGHERTAVHAGLLGLALVFLFGLHVVSVFALPWLVFLARGPAPRPPWRHLLVPLGFLSGIVLAVVLAGHGAAFLKFPAYWRAFLPELSLAAIADHARRAGTLAFSPTEGAPILTLVACSALALVLLRRASSGEHPWLSPLWLAGPHLGAFLLLGKPLVGLLLPVTLACALLFVQTAAAHARPRQRIAGLYVGLAICVQLWGGAALALERRSQPDDRRVQAELLAAALPRGATMIVGPIGHHQTWFTDAPAVILPDEIHARDVAGEADVLAFVTALAEREGVAHAQVFITSEAIEYLAWRWGTDGMELPLDPSGRIIVRREPELFLYPFAHAAN